MTIILSHLTDLQRVRIDVSDLPDITVQVQRSTQATFNLNTVVRGGAALPIIDGVAQLDDYEFSPDVENFYRIVLPPEFVPIEELDMQQRIATSIVTADSAGFTTTETVVATVVALLEIGRTYRVSFLGGFQSSIAGDQGTAFIREDNVAGASLQNRRVDIASTSSTTGYSGDMEAEFTATATGNKTFVATCQQFSGTGTLRLEAAAGRAAYLYVDYIRG